VIGLAPLLDALGAIAQEGGIDRCFVGFLLSR